MTATFASFPDRDEHDGHPFFLSTAGPLRDRQAGRSPCPATTSPAAVSLTAAAVRRRHERRETSDVGGVGP